MRTERACRNELFHALIDEGGYEARALEKAADSRFVEPERILGEQLK